MSQKRTDLFLYVFAVAVSANLIGDLISSGTVELISKPLIMASLIGYYLTAVSQPSSILVLAMIFCWAGDVLLMFQVKPGFFIAGLVAFLIGHVLYILTYRIMRGDSVEPVSGIHMARMSFPVVLIGTGLVVVLYPRLGPMQIPVMIYALVLTIMVLAAIFRYTRTTTLSFRWVVAGALLFMVSDSLLAINKFHTPFFQAGFFIMLTYSLAQWCIVRGLLLHTPAETKKANP